jgi:molybdate transport system ATP-binding protein
MLDDKLELRVQVTLENFELDVQETLQLEGVTAIFGPSGSGKSTLLRTIAGLEQPQSGRIVCSEQVWFDSTINRDVEPHRRPVGYMFQDARLFAHLDVAGNLAFASKRRRRELLGFTHTDVVSGLNLEPLLGRKVSSLSGGERQRVALGRTLLTAPTLLLLDEPLSALDYDRKAEILPYLDNLPTRFGIPTLYVSHDIDEVTHLADRVLVLAQGRVQAYGSTAQVFERLDLEPVTGRFEAGSVVEGTVAGHDGRLHLTRIDLHGAILTLPMLAHVGLGKPVRLRIRARDVAIATQRPEGLSIRNVLPGTLSEIVVTDEMGTAEVLVDVSGARIRARLTLAAVEELALEAGMPVFALIKTISLDASGAG